MVRFSARLSLIPSLASNLSNAEVAARQNAARKKAGHNYEPRHSAEPYRSASFAQKYAIGDSWREVESAICAARMLLIATFGTREGHDHTSHVKCPFVLALLFAFPCRQAEITNSRLVFFFLVSDSSPPYPTEKRHLEHQKGYSSDKSSSQTARAHTHTKAERPSLHAP